MTSWIVAIDSKYPQHWRIAAQHLFWDMTRGFKVKNGDDVFFWQTGPGAGLVGWTQAVGDAVAISTTMSKPWEDSGTRTYTHRFPFAVVSEDVRQPATLGALQQATSIRTTPNWWPAKVKTSEGEAWLAERFRARPPVPDVFLPPEVRIEVDGLLGHDLRERALRAIALRQGQPAFRSDLMRAYAGTCAVTGYRTESVLEAAHISPYLGGHTNGSPTAFCSAPTSTRSSTVCC